ncbi:MAG: shikimate kinase [Marinifilaceae bacterium]
MRYFLVGYMGCGKSYQGRLMAKELGIPFIDLDEWISWQEQCSIPEIFEQKGEACFREMERKALQTITERYADAVISTGGGTPCHFDNMAFMNKNGTTLFIQVSVDVLVERLEYGKKNRPLIAHLTREQLREFIETHLAQRLPYYQMAHKILDSN